jgi:hypothetical protein
MTKRPLPSPPSLVTAPSKSCALSVTDLVTRIKTHIEKGDQAAKKSEQHYVSAGQYLAQFKGKHKGSWQEWEKLLKTKVGIGKSRASELMQIADGRKSVQEVRADTAKRVREKAKGARSSPLANGENSSRSQPATNSNPKPNGATTPEAPQTEPPMSGADAVAEVINELFGPKANDALAAAVTEETPPEVQAAVTQQIEKATDSIALASRLLNGEELPGDVGPLPAAQAEAKKDEQAITCPDCAGTGKCTVCGNAEQETELIFELESLELLTDALGALLVCFERLRAPEAEIRSSLSPALYDELRRQFPLKKKSSRKAT